MHCIYGTWVTSLETEERREGGVLTCSGVIRESVRGSREEGAEAIIDITAS
jgi:hypothetical protein